MKIDNTENKLEELEVINNYLDGIVFMLDYIRKHINQQSVLNCEEFVNDDEKITFYVDENGNMLDL